MLNMSVTRRGVKLLPAPNTVTTTGRLILPASPRIRASRVSVAVPFNMSSFAMMSHFSALFSKGASQKETIPIAFSRNPA
jgi:hypothetical protein